MTTRALFLSVFLLFSPALVFAGGDVVNNGAGFRESQLIYIWNHFAEDLTTFRQTANLNAAEFATATDLIATRKAFVSNADNVLFKKETEFKFPISSNGQAASFATQAKVGSVIVVNQDWLYRHTTEGSFRQDYQESFLLLTHALLVQKPSANAGMLVSKISQWLNAEVKIINLAVYNLPQIQTKLVLNQILVNDEFQLLNLTEELRAQAPCADANMTVQSLTFSNLHYAAVQGVNASDTNLVVEVAGNVTYECQGPTQIQKIRGDVQWSLSFDRIVQPGQPTELRFHEQNKKVEALHDVLYFNLQEL
ncbi:hypothetical protein [Bdellovibrio sp. HCB337]|uniref:hypothetical protein n=1 Tax=Bdellovibrio sp. HCB337 TaxID=3394358 RepID=UPI0039A53EC6